MQLNTGVSAETLPLPLRQAAEELLGRSLKDDEAISRESIYTREDEML
jgi:hypothetical protein